MIFQAFRQEALLWRQLDHPRILPLLGIDTGMSPHFCMVSPWMEHNNVNRFLESNPKHNRLKMVSMLPIHELNKESNPLTNLGS